MKKFRDCIKDYAIIKYAEAKLKQSTDHMSKNIPWTQRKSLLNTIQSHCAVLLESMINKQGRHSFRENKFIVDSIFKYTLGKSENLLKSNKKAKDIKSYMQLNSYIVYDTINKGISENKNKKSIIFNIEKQLSEIQEEIDSKKSIDEILQSRISA